MKSPTTLDLERSILGCFSSRLRETARGDCNGNPLSLFPFQIKNNAPKVPLIAETENVTGKSKDVAGIAELPRRRRGKALGTSRIPME
jgi:hypothetical protein